jgi:hypothetical protein
MTNENIYIIIEIVYHFIYCINLIKYRWLFYFLLPQTYIYLNTIWSHVRVHIFNRPISNYPTETWGTNINWEVFSDLSLYIYIYIKNCWVRLLSNYNIKYICTIYTHLYTCLTCISRFALREKVTLRLLKLLFKGVDVVEWSRALSEWCCSVSMVWVQIPSREEQKFDSSKI